MAFGMVVSAQSQASVVPVAAIVSVGEKHILALVIAYPLVAARRLGQGSGLAAESALWSGRETLGLRSHLFVLLRRTLAFSGGASFAPAAETPC